MLLLVTIIKCQTLEVNFPVAYLFPPVFLGLKPAQCNLVLTRSRPKFVFEFLNFELLLRTPIIISHNHAIIRFLAIILYLVWNPWMFLKFYLLICIIGLMLPAQLNAKSKRYRFLVKWVITNKSQERSTKSIKSWFCLVKVSGIGDYFLSLMIYQI